MGITSQKTTQPFFPSQHGKCKNCGLNKYIANKIDPCNHIDVCLDCLEKINICPTCNTKIIDFGPHYKVFEAAAKTQKQRKKQR